MITIPTATRTAFLQALGNVAAKAQMPVDLFVKHVRNGRFGRTVQLVGRSLETKAGVIKRHRLWSVQRAR